MSGARACGLLLGYAADRLLGDPRRGHPVALLGRVAAVLERRLHRDRRGAGAAYTVLVVGGTTALGAGVARLARDRPLLEAGTTAVATWTVLGGRSLGLEARAVHALLEADDLPGARRRLTHLVGRDPSGLTPEEVARAVVESVAENVSDAVVAPLVWGAAGGVPGLLGYRAANTLDAMVGHRSPRHLRFGWASARLDDLLNLPASRLAGLLTAAAAPTHARAVLGTWRRDAAGHPSPNAGVVEAAFAGALGVRLGGTNRYGDRTEQRPVLGRGGPPVPADVDRAVALARRVGHLAVLGCAAAVARPRAVSAAAGATSAGVPRPGARRRDR